MGTHRNTEKKGSVLGTDYMANFSPASETNPPKFKLYLARGAIQRELKSGFSNRARIFSPAKWAWKSEKISYFSPGWSDWTFAVILFPGYKLAAAKSKGEAISVEWRR